MLENHLDCIYKLDELVGRGTVLSRINDEIARSLDRPQVLFLIGEGGAGKTRILEYLLDNPGQSWHTARKVVDFYDVLNHSASGLAISIYDVLFPNDVPPACFQGFQKMRRELVRQQAAGGSLLEQQRRRALKVFSENMNAFTQDRRVVIALDTVEKLIYHHDAKTAQVEDVAESWDWLLSSLASWGSVTLLIAGRPAVEGLLVAERHQRIDLPFLEEEGSLAYFEAVERACDDKDPELAKRVKQLSVENRLIAHRLANGRPILLALLIDFLSVGDKGGELKKVLENPDPQENLEELLITRLISQPSIGDTIQALGRAPKGVDQALLARLLDIKPDEAKRRLDNVRRFSFVKMPLNGERIFLHDELYRILQERVFNSPHDLPQAVDARDKIIGYIQEKLKSLKDRLISLYTEKDTRGNLRIKKNLDEIVETYNQKQNALSELVYYLLRQNAARGFRHYYRFVCEASNGLDTALDVWLQAEMSNYLKEMQTYDELDGFSREFAELVLELQIIIRSWNAGQNQAADQKALKFREKYATRLKQPEFAGLLAALQNWEAYKNIRVGGSEDLKEASRLLTDNIKKLGVAVKQYGDAHTRSDVKYWYAVIAFGYAYWVLGYLKRNQGYMNDAVALYRKAILYFRDANLDIYLAGTLNDQGYALCEGGNWHDAKPLVKEGLEKRRGLGPLAPVGLSLNTLGIVERFEGSNTLAVQYGEQALLLFEAANDTSGQGLALMATAESYQRLANEIYDDPESALKEKIRYYKRAIKYAKSAAEIFEERGEQIRQAEALKELGCAYRNLTLYARNYPDLVKENPDELVKKSQESLKETVRLAHADHFRKLEAEINRAYLAFFAGDEAMYGQAIENASKLVPKEYEIGQPLNAKAQQRSLFWTQLGKLHLLLGRHAIDKEGDFKLAIYHFALGLEYNSQYGSNYPGMLQSEGIVYDKLKVLASQDLVKACMAVKEFEAKDLKKDSFMRKFLVNRGLWFLDEDD